MALLGGESWDFDSLKELENVVSANGVKKSMSKDFIYDDTPRIEMLDFVPIAAKRILDVGCHMGAFGRALKNRENVEVWGVEPSPHTAEIASQQLDRVINGYFSEDIDLPEQYFDVIVFNDVLEHMEDPWKAIALAKAKLVDGGQIVASLPNLRHIENLIHLLKEGDFQYEVAGIRDKTHLRFFTKASIPRLFSEIDFQIVRVEGINEDWWRPSLIRRIAFRVFKTYLEDTRYQQFAVVAKKI